MRVFYMTSELPYPPVSGGRVRSLAELELLNSLPEVERIVLLTIAEEKVDEKTLAEFSKKIPKAEILKPIFHPIHLKAHKKWIPFVGAVRVAMRIPYLAAKWVSPRVGYEISRALSREKFDVVYIDHLGMACYLPLARKAAKGARIVLEQHNVESDFFKQFAEKKTGAMKFVASREYLSARKFEKSMMRSVDAVVAISTSDRDGFARMAEVRAHVVPQVVKFERTEWASPTKNGTGNGAGGGKNPRLVYVGNLGWHPNAEGLDWFAEKVWPIVQAKNPKITLTIGGSGLKKRSDGTQIVPEKWQRPGIECIGFVEDLGVFYKDAACFLAPILGGSGVRIKVLEAFRAGLPLVTTASGALGLPLEDGRECMIANDAEGYADAVVRVCESDDLQRRLREGGYGFLEKEHSLVVAQDVMRRVLGLKD